MYHLHIDRSFPQGGLYLVVSQSHLYIGSSGIPIAWTRPVLHWQNIIIFSNSFDDLVNVGLLPFRHFIVFQVLNIMVFKKTSKMYESWRFLFISTLKVLRKLQTPPLPIFSFDKLVGFIIIGHLHCLIIPFQSNV